MRHNDEPAFPRPAGESGNYENPAQDGMTLMDWFAGQALSAMRFAITEEGLSPPPAAAADWAYCIARFMLAEREAK